MFKNWDKNEIKIRIGNNEIRVKTISKSYFFLPLWRIQFTDISSFVLVVYGVVRYCKIMLNLRTEMDLRYKYLYVIIWFALKRSRRTVIFSCHYEERSLSNCFIRVFNRILPSIYLVSIYRSYLAWSEQINTNYCLYEEWNWRRYCVLEIYFDSESITVMLICNMCIVL